MFLANYVIVVFLILLLAVTFLISHLFVSFSKIHFPGISSEHFEFCVILGDCHLGVVV